MECPEASLTCSASDLAFQEEVESYRFPVSDFNHRAHVRLAYIYLVAHENKAATEKMHQTLLGLLKCAGIDPSEKFHVTLTHAWILAVRHFMSKTRAANSAKEFIDQHPQLLDSKIMMTHYSADVLFSEKTRCSFVPPDLDPIP